MSEVIKNTGNSLSTSEVRLWIGQPAPETWHPSFTIVESVEDVLSLNSPAPMLVIALAPEQQDQVLADLRSQQITALSLIFVIEESLLSPYLANGVFNEGFRNHLDDYLNRLQMSKLYDHNNQEFLLLSYLWLHEDCQLSPMKITKEPCLYHYPLLSSWDMNPMGSFIWLAKLCDKDWLDTEEHARQYAIDNAMTYVSPYNDADVIVGQASCGVEIANQINNVDALFVAVGGGGLIAGVAGFLRSVNPRMQVIGCQPTAAPIMAASIKARRLLDMPSETTLSDGTAGAIEAGAITFDLCQKLVDDYALVPEEEIALAMREFIDAHHMLLEGAAGVALAGLKQFSQHCQGRNVVVIICGANINRDTLRKNHLVC